MSDWLIAAIEWLAAVCWWMPQFNFAAGMLALFALWVASLLWLRRGCRQL